MKMSKRFIDISILPKAFRKLSPSLKLTWYYIWNNCDKSGVWEIDEELFEFENGFELNLLEFKQNFADLVEILEEKIFLKDFIKINYGTLKTDYNPHKPVFRDIVKNNLKLDPSLNQAYLKLEDEEENEDEYKEEDKDEMKGGVGENKKEELNYQEIIDIFNSVCFELPNAKLTDSRKKLINARIKDYSLEHIGIVFRKVVESDFLSGRKKDWKATFDWIMSKNNFVKILEDNYKNLNNNGTSKSTEQQFAEALNSEVARSIKL